MNTNYFKKKKKFHLFYKALLKKNFFYLFWSKTKKYLVVLHDHKINSLHVYYLISCLIFGLFYFFLSLCKIEYFGTVANSSYMFCYSLSIISVFLKEGKKAFTCTMSDMLYTCTATL